MTEEDTARLAALKAKLKARDGKPGYKQNCADIREEIARLEAIDGEPA